MNNEAWNLLKFLDINKLVDFNVIGNDSEEGLINRIKTQKFVYIAQKCFGIELGYEYNIYRYGPYSPDLANDYFNLDVEKMRSSVGYSLPNFDTNKFLNIVNDKNAEWLEVATTLLDVSSEIKDNHALIEQVSGIKAIFPKTFIEKTYNDLIHYSLLNSVNYF